MKTPPAFPSRLHSTSGGAASSRALPLLLALLLALPALADDSPVSSPSSPSSPSSSVRQMALDDCIALALENNLDLRIQRLTRTAAAIDAEGTRGAYDPSLALSAKRSRTETEGTAAGTSEGVLSTTRTETDENAFTAGLQGDPSFHGLSYDLSARAGDSSGTRASNPFDTTTASAGLTLTQPLLRGFKAPATRYRIATAQSLSDEAALALEQKIQTTVAAVETAFYALIQARETIAVREKALALAEQLAADTERKVSVGTAFALDARQASSQAATARAELSDAHRAAGIAHNDLKALVFADQRAVRNLHIDARYTLDPARVPTDPAASGDLALDLRPDIRAQRLALARQGIEVEYRRNQTLPSLDLVLGAGVAASDEDSYPDAWSQLASADEPYWTAGLALTFPLGNRTAASAHRQALANAERMRLELRRLEESALVEVENATAALDTGWEKIASTREARACAEEALAAEQKKLDSGQSTPFIVLQLQRDLTTARQSEIAALTDYLRLASALSLAEGTLLQRHNLDLDTAPVEP